MMMEMRTEGTGIEKEKKEEERKMEENLSIH